MKPPALLLAVPSALKPSPLMCECVAVLFSLAFPFTSLICTPPGAILCVSASPGTYFVRSIILDYAPSMGW